MITLSDNLSNYALIDVESHSDSKALLSLKAEIDVRNPEVTSDTKFCSSAYYRRTMWTHSTVSEVFNISINVDQGVNMNSNVKYKT